MFRNPKGVILLLLAGLLALSVAGLSQEPKRGGTLTVGITQQILNLDPHVATAFSSWRVMEQIYEGLLRFDEQLRLQPALAESWTISPDGKEYVFELRRGVVFHDGTPLTAEDVKYTFERVLDPKTSSPLRSRISLIESIEILGPYKVKFTLSKPYAPFLDVLPLIFIVPKDFEEKVGDPRVHTLGTGPFKLVEIGPDYVKLARNVDYWDKGLPYLDEVVIRQIPDPATLRSALRAGQVDLIFGFGVDVTTIGAFAGLPGFKVASVPGLNYSLLGINNSRAPFDDVRVRRALSLAIDRQQIVDIVYFGRAAVAGPIPPALVKWDPLPPSELPYYTRDVERARALLEEAGAVGFTFKIMPIPTVPEAIQIAQVIQAQLKDIGVKAEIESVDFATFLKRWRESDFDTFVSLNSGATDPDVHLYRHIYSTGSTNVFKFSDDVVDELLERGRTTTDPEARREIYRELQIRIAEQVPFLFLTYPEIFAVMKADVRGFTLLPTQSIVSLRETWLDR